MRFGIFSLSFLAAATVGHAGLVQRAACNADNCARSVTGTNVPVPSASRRADCSSFQRVTVTPAAATSTVTVTPSPVPVTVVQTVPSTAVVTPLTSIFIGDSPSNTASPERRQASGGAVTNSPTAVPSYATTPCAGSVSSRYASACSCWGVTKTTTTLAAATSVVTVTAATPTYTVTATVVDVSTATAPQATVTVVPGTRPACGSTITGTGGCKCTYTVTCNAMYQGGRIIQTLNLLSELDCVNACDGYDNCFNVDYSRVTGQCNIYQRAENVVAINDDDAFAFAGNCGTNGGAPGCVIG